MTDSSTSTACLSPESAPQDLELQLDWSAYRDAGMGDAYADIPKYGGHYAKAIAACINSRQCEAAGKQVMCPSYRVSGDPNLATGGRVRLLKAALSTRQDSAPLLDPELQQAMDLCVSCKGCKRECESSVDMPLIKAEYLAQKYALQPRSWRSRLMASLPQWQHQHPWLDTLIQLRNRSGWLRRMVDPVMGLNPAVKLPVRSAKRLEALASPAVAGNLNGHKVAMFVDTFTRYYEPHIVEAAITVLEAGGYQVRLLQPDAHASGSSQNARPYCCGRTWLAQGMIDRARTEASRLIQAILPLVEQGYSIVGLEASCVLGLRDDAQALGLGEAAVTAAKHSLLFEEFIARESKSGRLNLPLSSPVSGTLVHGHCHQKAVGAMKSVRRVLKLIPEHSFDFIESSCCGMAGSFGLEAEHAQHSLAMAQQGLLPALSNRGDRQVLANGFSCRQQIRQHSDARPMHLAELLADCLVETAGRE
ncbi:(Fe-S)-binding protein [Oceanobacter sp. 4_MG-2023]|uniref:(Fe-S)-binding protein n=1 Tax=Oceanobacter sp. 4_MG-2023 TaxID=3062623 RepID=UPI0027340104|nr:(Fe-S)-binding protein [Oceanobacter sp. 4_MG-2023]MDP2546635.1 (Fe-S)-binding protein [Oceanobacter sp. 4_MG-2023]